MIAKNAEYVQAARVLGFRDARILLRHILPNVLSVGIVFAAADVVMCHALRGLPELPGAGRAAARRREWGAIISEGRAYLAQGW